MLDLPPQDASRNKDVTTFLVGNPYKPLFATVTGWAVDPIFMFVLFPWVSGWLLPYQCQWLIFINMNLGLYIVMSVQYSDPESTSPEVDEV